MLHGLLQHGLRALHTGRMAELQNGQPRTGSSAGFPPDRRAALESVHGLSRWDFQALRPTVRVTVTVVFTDTRGRVLLVKPGYTERWLLPGGGVDCDTGETPPDAAAREVGEELGLPATVERLLAIDWVSGSEPHVGFVYDGGALGAETLRQIRLPSPELRDWRLFALDEMDETVLPARVISRIAACLSARGGPYSPLELYDGRPRLPGPTQHRFAGGAHLPWQEDLESAHAGDPVAAAALLRHVARAAGVDLRAEVAPAAAGETGRVCIPPLDPAQAAAVAQELYDGLAELSAAVTDLDRLGRTLRLKGLSLALHDRRVRLGDVPVATADRLAALLLRETPPSPDANPELDTSDAVRVAHRLREALQSIVGPVGTSIHVPYRDCGGMTIRVTDLDRLAAQRLADVLRAAIGSPQ
ncbi:NUDIX domain-containing protein [Streptomyces sp. NRRL F-5053]|uniref:NUDIX domain-containing protein n=1 Tax=Streptomyces sp. NRRL F-5053 TaxID=1463854 RepID=UPI00068AC293|nr:NUDIX hydrolase [Streptomyces sp. NRRL F-5053]